MLARNRRIQRFELGFPNLVAVGLILATAALGIRGISRSLWLDEAWVANSIAAPSLHDMFYYPGWLQTTPPLFLVAARGAVGLLGLSNVSLRIVPLIFALLAVASFLVVVRRMVSSSIAILAAALLVFSPATIEYAHTSKQYSGELLATTLILAGAIAYVRSPSRHRYYWLTAVVVLALPLAYSSVFLLPGVVLAVYRENRRPALLVGLTGGVLAILFIFFIRPNYSPDLHRFWRIDAEAGFSPGLVAEIVFVILAAGRVAISLMTKRSGWRVWTQILCVLPCLLLAGASALGWYPLSYRTRLFVLPCFLLLVAINLDDLLNWTARRIKLLEGAGMNVAVGLLSLAVAIAGIKTQFRDRASVPKEDVAGAVAFLQRKSTAQDLILVHPSAGESFVLYARMYGWDMPPAIYGDTGWPCCPRGKVWRPEVSTEKLVNADIDRRVPSGYSGRIWMLYTIRPTHWVYTWQDESQMWRYHLAERGCYISPPNREFENLEISMADCAPIRRMANVVLSGSQTDYRQLRSAAASRRSE
jgi:Dolichyl-phosphate-mannose-protein mannosyltransferase